jgi:hypothetical protein
MTVPCMCDTSRRSVREVRSDRTKQPKMSAFGRHGLQDAPSEVWNESLD